jgi:hypothetical protein
VHWPRLRLASTRPTVAFRLASWQPAPQRADPRRLMSLLSKRPRYRPGSHTDLSRTRKLELAIGRAFPLQRAPLRMWSSCQPGESAQMGSRSSRFMSLPRQSHIETAIWPYSRLVSRDGAHHQCLCGHPYVAHQHYRSGSECSFCSDCTRYRTGRVGIVRIVALLYQCAEEPQRPSGFLLNAGHCSPR